MFKNELRVFLRSVAKHKIFTFLKITGLVTGMTVFILIILWIRYEQSYDRFHSNIDALYRVATSFHDAETARFGLAAPGPAAPALKEEFPEIVNAGRLMPSTLIGDRKKSLRYKERLFATESLYLADPSFFEMFSFVFIRGQPETALLGPMSIILSQSLAERIFQEEDPLAKQLVMDGQLFEVTGIVKDVPPNSHIQFEAVIPMEFALRHEQGFFLNKWDSFAFPTYIQLQDDANVEEIEKKTTSLILEKLAVLKKTFPVYLHLQSLKRIHLYDLEGGGPIQYIYIFVLVAVLVLFIACINHLNLSSAGYEKRIREFGIRKVVGSTRVQLIKQILVESMAFMIVSFLVAMDIVHLLLPDINRLIGTHISLANLNFKIMLLFAMVLLASGIISSLQPALRFSSSNAAHLLKEDKLSALRGLSLRKILVITQFVISVGLIISTIVVNRQVTFMREAELGFSKENVVSFPIPETDRNTLETIKNELLKLNDIAFVTGKSNPPTQDGGWTGTIEWEGKNPELRLRWYHPMVDYDYFQTLGMQVAEGWDFSKDLPTDITNAFILNEEAAKQGGLSSPVGMSFSLNGKDGTIIGVVKNAQLASLKEEIQPVVYHLSKTYQEEFQTIIIRTKAMQNDGSLDRVTRMLSSIENVLMEHYPDFVFEYHFLDETIDAQYRSEIRVSRLFQFFTGVAIFISCLGLFGLTLVLSEQRTKEIAIRKVLGASVVHITMLLSKRYLAWVIIANGIAWPVVFFPMHAWLQNFAHRISIGGWIFVATAGLTIVIAFLTISFHIIKAALRNPVTSLKYE